MNSKTSKLSSAFTKAGKALTVGLTLPIAGLITNGVKYNGTIEQLSTSFEVMTGSADEAQKIIKKLKKAAAKTPYELTGLAKTTQMLMQYGFTSEDAYDATIQLGDISQGSAEKMESIAYAYGQMSSAGKVNLQDIRQMINAGFNPLQTIAEKTGKSMQQVTKEYEEGKISVEDITDAMKYASGENGKYYKSMEKQSETLNGKLSTLKDGFNEASGELVKSLLPAITQVINKVTKLFTWFTNLDDGQKKIILKILGIVAVIGPFLLIVGKIIGFIDLLTKATWLWNGALLASPITWIVLGIIALIAIIVLLVKHWDKVKEAMATMWEGVKVIFTKIKDFIGKVFKGIANAFISLINLIIRGINSMIRGFLSPINALIKGYNKTIGKVTGKISTITISIPTIPKLETGTNYTHEGLHYLHEGEAVVPKKYNPAIGGIGRTMTLNIEMGDINMDGNKVGRAVVPYITKTVKVAGGNV